MLWCTACWQVNLESKAIKEAATKQIRYVEAVKLQDIKGEPRDCLLAQHFRQSLTACINAVYLALLL